MILITSGHLENSTFHVFFGEHDIPCMLLVVDLASLPASFFRAIERGVREQEERNASPPPYGRGATEKGKREKQIIAKTSNYEVIWT